mmetsp:Transcript_569/g.859  ORF Transcript_569/g.859 Transcript_569/m.859 type:complete len:214 (+) Transcript_569:2917-3558(+)
MTRIRVKRPRSECPVDVLVIDSNKRYKSVDSILSELNLSGSRQIFRRVSSRQKHPATIGFTQEFIEERKQKRVDDWHRASMEKRYEQAIRQRKTHSYILAATTEVILCDGVPLTRYRLQGQDHPASLDLVEEEYEQVRADDEEVLWLAQGVVEMRSDECSEDRDSEDSNCEGHAWNEYPDEESQGKSSNNTDEGFSSGREDYSDYVVESDSDW